MSNSKALTIVSLLQEMEETLEKNDLMDVLEGVDGADYVGFYTYSEENDPMADSEYRIGTDDEDVSDIFDDVGFVYMNSVVDVFTDDDEY
jgi:hypothetical protein